MGVTMSTVRMRMGMTLLRFCRRRTGGRFRFASVTLRCFGVAFLQFGFQRPNAIAQFTGNDHHRVAEFLQVFRQILDQFLRHHS